MNILPSTLQAAYAEPHRHYHNLRHVHDCLDLLERFRNCASNPDEIAIALWFHDAVYDPRRQDNEERSAEWAVDYLRRTKAPADAQNRIKDLILATKTHKGTTPDEHLIIDLDLAILGASPARFQAYDDAIRREYAWVPPDVYEPKRRQVLKSFLDRQFIYHHLPVRQAFEQSARGNLLHRLSHSPPSENH